MTAMPGSANKRNRLGNQKLILDDGPMSTLILATCPVANQALI